jgi:hypothetical protein
MSKRVHNKKRKPRRRDDRHPTKVRCKSSEPAQPKKATPGTRMAVAGRGFPITELLRRSGLFS